MVLSGKHLARGSREDIWGILMDSQSLARITPGVDHLELIEDDVYRAVADVRIGPVRGNFTGKVTIGDKHPTESFKLFIDQKSKIGNAKAEIEIRLDQQNEGTEVSFEGKVKMSGLLARTGQRVIGGVVNMLSKQFFEALDGELGSSDGGVA